LIYIKGRTTPSELVAPHKKRLLLPSQLDFVTPSGPYQISRHSAARL
jgi:hypothetical protein